MVGSGVMGELEVNTLWAVVQHPLRKVKEWRNVLSKECSSSYSKPVCQYLQVGVCEREITSRVSGKQPSRKPLAVLDTTSLCANICRLVCASGKSLQEC